MMVTGAVPASAVASTLTSAVRMRARLMSAIRRLPSTSPYLPCSAELPAQANAPSMSAIPAQVGEKPNSAISRYGI